MAKTLTQKIEELEGKVRNLRDEVEEKEEELQELKGEVETLLNDPKHDGSIKGMEEIKYLTSGNLMDMELMEAMGRALESVSVLELIQELNTLIRINQKELA